MLTKLTIILLALGWDVEQTTRHHEQMVQMSWLILLCLVIIYTLDMCIESIRAMMSKD